MPLKVHPLTDDHKDALQRALKGTLIAQQLIDVIKEAEIVDVSARQERNQRINKAAKVILARVWGEEAANVTGTADQ